MLAGVLGQYAALYEALFAAGHVLADEVDRQEVWQAAAALGVRPDTGTDLLAARVAAAKEGKPPPEVPGRGPGPSTMPRRNLRAGG